MFLFIVLLFHFEYEEFTPLHDAKLISIAVSLTKKIEHIFMTEQKAITLDTLEAKIMTTIHLIKRTEPVPNTLDVASEKNLQVKSQYRGTKQYDAFTFQLIVTNLRNATMQIYV